MRNILIFIVLLMFSASASGQEAVQGSVIRMNGSFLQQMQDRDSVLIADQVLYGFDLSGVKEGTLFAFPQLKDTLMTNIRVVSPWKMDTVKVVRQKKGQPALLDLKGGVVITSFDEGIYVLPPLAVLRMSSDGVADTLVFEPQRLEVKTMPVDTATFVPHDIKGQIGYPVTFREVVPWVAAGLGSLALVCLAVWLLVRMKRRHDPAYAHKDPAHIVALRKLDRYRGSKMWVPEKQKAFYSGVTDTLREYIAARYGIGAMEMTTAEIFAGMKESDVPEELLEALRELFERADFVKFAKFVASEEENAAALPLAVRFVTSTYQTNLAGTADDKENEGGE